MWLDAIVTGAAPANLEKRLDLLFSNYKNVSIYEIGSPNTGVNSKLTEYAFKNCFPLDLGCPEDAENMAKRISYAEHTALVIFVADTMSKYVRENIAAAQKIARMAGITQVRILRA